jgi:hypothetical protein
VLDGFGDVVVDDELDDDEQAVQQMRIPRDAAKRTRCGILTIMRRKRTEGSTCVSGGKCKVTA